MSQPVGRDDAPPTEPTADAARPTIDDFVEACPECDRETPHGISIEIRVENEAADNPLLSREPYRVSVCEVCGHTESKRMNNA